MVSCQPSITPQDGPSSNNNQDALQDASVNTTGGLTNTTSQEQQQIDRMNKEHRVLKALAREAYEKIIIPDFDPHNAASVSAYNKAIDGRRAQGDPVSHPGASYIRMPSMDELVAVFKSLSPGKKSIFKKFVSKVLGSGKGKGKVRAEDNMDVDENEDKIKQFSDEVKGQSDSSSYDLDLSLSKEVPYNSSKHNQDSLPTYITQALIGCRPVSLVFLLPKTIDCLNSATNPPVKIVCPTNFLGKTVKKRITVPDPDKFDDKYKMNIHDWTVGQLAWQQFIKQSESAKNSPVYNRFKRHYKDMIAHPEFTQNFPAFRAHDIKYCTKYCVKRVAHDKKAWGESLDCKLRNPLNLSIASQNLLHSSSSHSRSSHLKSFGSQRFAPYNSKQNSYSSKSSTPKEKQFCSSSGSSNKSNTSSSKFSKSSSKSLLCLICQCDHRFLECNEEKTEQGKPVFATYQNNKLFVKGKGGKTICPSFNLCSQGCQNHDNKDHVSHICSFCGDPDHPAFSRSCDAFEGEA